MNQSSDQTPDQCADNPPTRSRIIETANIDWQYNTPVSNGFSDVYFSRDCGEEETRHVFLHHNQLEQRWSNPQLSQFTIAETGFGTGLNFLCAADLWQQLKQSDALPAAAHLHFVSVERYPLDAMDMAHACSMWPQFEWLTDALLEQYPAPVKGFHRLYFAAANITLSLIFDDAISGFQQLDGTVDAWFLDGFAPALNPAMWQPELFAEMARLSRTGTTLATFTSAGVVKRGLKDAGFRIEKVAGYGRKRDMLRAEFQAPDATLVMLPPEQKPWFRFDYRAATSQPGQVAVIGAGLAGATVANRLAQRGWQVTVLEQETRIAGQGSGNPTGMTYTKLSLHDTPQNRFYQWAYLYACRYLAVTLREGGAQAGVDWDLNGLLRLAYNQQEADEQAALLTEQYWPQQLMEGLSAEQIEQRLGLTTNLSGILLHGGGWLNPATLCRILLQHSNITVHTGFQAKQLLRQGQRWQVLGENVLDEPAPQYDAVVLANAFGANCFIQTDQLPLKPVRGQITYLPATDASRNLRHAVNYEGYINPARDGYHCVGATFNPRMETASQRPEDHQWNCDKLRAALPALADALQLPEPSDCTGRVGFRCQTPDYLPIIGPVPDAESYLEAYGDLGKGFLKRDFPLGPNHPGLFVTCGHGSRGITSASLAAEVISAYLCGEPQPVDREVLFAIHPARFLIRNIIRRSL